MKLVRGRVYLDKKRNEKVEFGYMGQTGLAIVYEPGDSGGGAQSSWGIDPNDLVDTAQECSVCLGSGISRGNVVHYVPSFGNTNMQVCPYCRGTGKVGSE